MGINITSHLSHNNGKTKLTVRFDTKVLSKTYIIKDNTSNIKNVMNWKTINEKYFLIKFKNELEV